MRIRFLSMQLLLACAASLAAPVHGATAQRGGERWAEAGTTIGATLPRLEVVEFGGRRHPLADAWAKGPVLIVTSSVTCPIARGSCAELPRIRDELRGTAEVILLYTTEAHPTNSPSPYRPKDGPWVTADNERDGILRDQPTTLESRLALAREFKEKTHTDLPIVVDGIDNAAWTALGGGPNMAVLVDSSGAVRLKQGWLDPKTISEQVRKELDMASTRPAADGSARIYSASGHDITPLSKERVAELAKSLSPEAYKVTQRAATEPSGSCGVMLDNHKDGVYTCVVCGLPLFSSEHKFHSGTGWPSFFSPFDPQHIAEHKDTSLGMVRVEINCARCGSHLGHVFDDGPRDKTGLRYCLNGVALEFHAKEDPLPPESRPAKASADAAAPASSTESATSAAPAPSTETAYFAGGCFWGIEHVFSQCPGVLDAESGYMNGRTQNPTYEQVCDKKSGHAETVKVVFDPKRVSYRQLLEGFFMMHDPTQLNRQGPDFGDQYRSAVFTVNDRQFAEAKAIVQELAASRAFKAPIVTVIEPAKTFYKAEQYHQDYVDRTGNACHVSNPWPKVLGAGVR